MSDAPRRVVRVICGPTAAGKSALAMRLAATHRVAIVSADSRQIYRGFDVGTAKPSADERASVRHFGVDVADPAERYSAARWAEAVDGWIAESDAIGREPVIVGGTGLYLRALSEPLFVEPPLDAERRTALAAIVDAMSTEELRRWTRDLDPPRSTLGRTQLLRAVEVALLTGERVSALHARCTRAARHTLRYLVVDPGRELLRDWIAARVVGMCDAGWVDEVHRLIATVPADAPAWNASGYETLRRHVLGELSLAEAQERIVIETRQFAKRQRTWFRHQLDGADVTRLDPTAPNADDVAEAWWAGAGHSTGAT